MFKLSLIESNNYHVKIHRSNGYLEQLNYESTLKYCYNNVVDVLKMKVAIKDSLLFQTLSKLPFPHEVQSLVAKQTVDLRINNSKTEVDPLFSSKLADQTDLELLGKVIEEVLSQPTAENYAGSIHYYSKEAYIKNSIEYIKSFVTAPDSAVWIAYYNEIPCGFFSGIFSKDTFEGILYGISPEFRGKKLSITVYQAMKNICLEKELFFFTNDIEVNNIGSMKGAASIGMNQAIFYHINLFPFLSEDSKIECTEAAFKKACLALKNSKEYNFRINDYTKETRTLFGVKKMKDRLIHIAKSYSNNKLIGHSIVV